MWEILFLPGGRARLCHYSTQSRETTTREGGRQQRAVRKQSGSVLPPDDLQVKGRTQSAFCAGTVKTRVYLTDFFFLNPLTAPNLPHSFTLYMTHLLHV